MKITNALEQFVIQLEADGRSPHTIGQYRRHIRALAAWVGPRRTLGAVRHEDIARFLAAPVARTTPRGGIKKANSVNALRSSLRGFFGYCRDAGLVGENPTRLVRRALCGKPVPKMLTDDEQRRLLDAVDHPRDRMLFRLLLGTGIRIGSALALEVPDLDFGRSEIALQHCKGDREERVFLPRAVAAELQEFVAGRTGRVFEIGHRHAHRRLRSWLAKAGITRAAGPHALRHSFATSLYARTHDLLLVQRALRHRNIASTMVYAHLDDGRVREALEG